MTARASPSEDFDPPFRWAVGVLFLVTLLAYLPSLSGGFLWDDDGHVTKPALRSWHGLTQIWTEPAATQQYYPLLHSAFWLEHRLWGDNPLGYRLLNVLLHATAACLFAALLRKLAVRGVWLAAFLFALHPVCVESVAWITEQKNTLSLVFYLAAALVYFRFSENRRGSAYALATTFFIAALLCKTVTAALPAALLVILWRRNGRLSWRRDVVPLLPWFALGFAAGVVTSWVEAHLIGAEGEDFALSLLQRGLLAGRIVWFYLGKLFYPADLIFIYPRWSVETGDAASYAFPLGIFAVLAALAWGCRKSRGPLAALLLFAGTLLPALGFVDIYPFKFSFVADHFQYHASLAIFAAAGAGITMLFARLPRWSLLAAAATLLATLATLTARQSAAYRSNLILFETTVEKNPGAWMAHSNLAVILEKVDRLPEALVHIERAAALHPNAPEVQNTLGHLLTLAGRAPEAVPALQRALAVRPTFPGAHNNLGIAFMATRKTAEAIAEFQEAVRLDPSFPTARFNLGLALAHTGRTTEAIDHFQHALRLDPDYADAELHWGVCLTLQRKHTEAAPHYERAIRLNPTSAETVRLYGVALGQTDQIPAAIAQLRRALALQPDLAQAHLDLAQLLRFAGQLPEADAHDREFLRLRDRAASGR